MGFLYFLQPGLTNITSLLDSSAPGPEKEKGPNLAFLFLKAASVSGMGLHKDVLWLRVVGVID